MAKQTAFSPEETQQQIEAQARLRQLFEHSRGNVYALVRKVSTSGMTRYISLFVPSFQHDQTPSIEDIAWLINRAYPNFNKLKEGSFVVIGVGMDMGFALVYELSANLYRNQPKPSWASKRDDRPEYFLKKISL